MNDCRNCTHWTTCPCGKQGHDKGTSIGYSSGECKDYKWNATRTEVGISKSHKENFIS